MSREQLAGSYVGQQIYALLNNGNEAEVRAALARLRRGVGKAPGSMPEPWAYTMDGLPEALQGRPGQTSNGEWAVHIAMTLFALHQQGKDPKRMPMHMPEVQMGKAAGRLVRIEEDDLERVKRRFDAVITSDSVDELATHLRGLIQIMRAQDPPVPLDYVALAQDLYGYQNPERRDDIRLNWGRDFYGQVSANRRHEAAEKERDGEQDE